MQGDTIKTDDSIPTLGCHVCGGHSSLWFLYRCRECGGSHLVCRKCAPNLAGGEIIRVDVTDGRPGTPGEIEIEFCPTKERLTALRLEGRI